MQSIRALARAAIAAALLPLLPAAARPQSAFPKLFLYAATRGSGWPIINANGSVNMQVAKRISRYQLLTLNSTPFFDLRPGIVDTIRAMNPAIRILCYDLYGQRFPFATAGTNWKAKWDAVNIKNGTLFGLDSVAFVNPSNPWPNFGWPRIAASLDSIVIVNEVRRGHGDGVFVDMIDGPISGLSSDTGSHPDCGRAGFASTSDFDSARTAAIVAFAKLLHGELKRPIVVGNGIIPDTLAPKIWDGFMFEGWPFMRGFAAGLPVYRASGEYATIATYCSTCSASGDGTQYNAASAREVRLGLGSACMGSGYAGFSRNRDLPRSGSTYLDWWYDEYSVTPVEGASAGGVSDSTGAHVGWLGRPIEDARQEPGGAWLRQFEHGIVIVNGTRLAVNVDVGNERQYRRIRGVVDPGTNNGGVSGQLVNIPAADALFLCLIPGPGGH
jgi:hypothetical protein